MNYYKYFLLLLISFAVIPLMAQPTLPDEEVDVIKDFEATLEESQKINLIPQLPELDTTARQLTYRIPSKKVAIQYEAPLLRPLAVKKEEVPVAYDAFLKLGYGTPNRPYAELSYNNARNEKYDIGGHIKYHTANNKSREHQRFRDIGANLNGSYFFDQGYAVSGGLGYQFDEVHFYGYDNEQRSELRGDVKQQFGTFAANAKFFNGLKTQGDLNYSAGFDFYALNDNFASKEFGVDFELGLTKWFNTLHPLTVFLDADFTNFENGEKQTLHNFGIRPSFTFHGDRFKAKLGANLTSHKDQFKVFPDVLLSANIVGNQLAAYLGAQGGYYKNSFKNLTDYNPYLISRPELRNTDYYQYYGGVKGNLRIVDYQVQANFKKANNLSFFINERSDTIRFTPVYDDGNIFSIEGTLEAQARADTRVLLTLLQNFYDLDVLEKPYHLPTFSFSGAVFYTTFRDKIEIKGMAFFENGVPYLTTDNKIDNLGSLFDLNIGAKYKVLEKVGVFLDLNNILNNKRERWNNYPIYGFNVLGGVTVKF